MLQPLISKRAEGVYELSEAGLARAYLLTMQRLLVHYAQQALKASPEETQRIQQELPNLVNRIVKRLDDYFDQLPQFAQLIKETNTGRLGAYIGQHFMPQLEKVKEKLLETEIPKYKAEYENPYRVPSNDLLLLYAEEFAKAPPLNYKPFDPGEAEAEKAKSVEIVLPGEDPTASGPRPPPGQILLERYAPLFITARPLVYSPNTGSDAETEDIPLPKVPQQISFRNFVSIINTVARYVRAQDQQGYAKYYASLPPVHQVAYNFYTLFQKSAQQQEVNWADELQKAMQRAQLDAACANKLKDEVEAYRKVAQSLQRALAAGQQKGMPAQLAQSIYPQLVTIFENNGSLAEKRTALKMCLLQVTEPTAKEAMSGILLSQLEELATLYGLE
ncbi:MAG: hypothetical protein N2Z22_00720 [Turneriella sp.]|nr:hypothetical protein [Turneriella sp.]